MVQVILILHMFFQNRSAKRLSKSPGLSWNLGNDRGFLNFPFTKIKKRVSPIQTYPWSEGETRTPGILLPKQARYQLRYTRIGTKATSCEGEERKTL